MPINNTIVAEKKKWEPLLGQPVVYTEIRGSRHTSFKGVLTELFDNGGLITLDRDVHFYDSYFFGYMHLFLNEATIEPWDKATDDTIKGG